MLMTPCRDQTSASIDLARSLGSLSVTTTLFASNISHPIFVDRGGAYRIINLSAPTRNRGAELLATWRKAPFSATASYTLLVVRGGGGPGASRPTNLCSFLSFGKTMRHWAALLVRWVLG